MPTSPVLWTSTKLREATRGELSGAVQVRGVCIDTRTLQPGDLFIALIGHNSDGHRYLKQALEAGASCVMAHDEAAIAEAGLTDDPRLLKVTDTMQALEDLGRYRRSQFQGKVIAITGSVGKTTTKNMLATALAAYGKVHASVASFNNHWGVPLTLARLPKEADFCISEVGMNHPGEIAPLAAQIRPHIGIISTIGNAHLGHMGSIDAIAEEKAALFAALPASGIALCPEASQGLARLKEALPAGVSLWQVGTTEKATIQLTDLTCTAEGSHLHLLTPQGETDMELTAPGPHLARNAALALGTIAALGLSPAAGAEALRHFLPEAGRGQQRLLPGNVTLLDESYNASGPSICAAIETLALMPAERHVAALGDIRELGAFAEAEHRALAGPLIKHDILTFCCGPHMKSLYEALPPSLQGGYAETSVQLASLLHPALKDGDALLVKGSLGSNMRALIALLEQPVTTTPHAPESA
ncbi:UDP-N-acetylmuramoyl-tripeptide--D-alanyl-D-alanine ligase [Bombella sp. TMW 2.2559]|uniref:UDP-N-acetylmuramoyl-tripeptide--D-alanyl-D-alanine ligase n=1 Tax=Bombella dulcis TaxID=2967339 RepID=A0ABT3WA60_9PROT|nr:UDP-N-acetylmuramoyl-tripeptide--D-alanyl-D-alanine ligase [Bombella dulcis]MCX5615966.1 UDP-N-acetylmuramoyl-tripeptide--D-alanyl-D-alanine ligase [Bombella dulcis]